MKKQILVIITTIMTVLLTLGTHSFAKQNEKTNEIKYIEAPNNEEANEVTFHSGLLEWNKDASLLLDAVQALEKEGDIKSKSNKTLTVTATAYTAYCDGCSGTTYTGIDLVKNPNQKVIAVDPDVIPLGSKVYVEGYGTAIAADIGSAINGHRIDVFIPSESKAFKWGVKEVDVTILS
jgi:3D (Asp-Asp-Asp) domain-containing protein